MVALSPGEKLQQIYDLAEEAGETPHGGLTLQELEDQKSAVVERLSHLKKAIYADLDKDRIPSIKIEDFKDRDWYLLAQRGKAPFQKLFNRFQEELSTDGLSASFHEAHDAGGMKEWLAVKVQSALKKEFDLPSRLG